MTLSNASLLSHGHRGLYRMERVREKNKDMETFMDEVEVGLGREKLRRFSGQEYLICRTAKW